MGKEYRIIFEPDPEPDKSWLDQPQFAGCNPDDHLMVLGRVECQSSDPGGVGPWMTVASLGNIDSIPEGVEDCEPFELGEFEPGTEFRNAYQNDVATDLMAEALEAETHPDPKLVELFRRPRRIEVDLFEPIATTLRLMQSAVNAGQDQVVTPRGTYGIAYHQDDEDEDQVFGFIPAELPEGIKVEIDGNTYGTIDGLRFYVADKEPTEHSGTVGAALR